MTEFFHFASENPFLTFFLAIIICSAIAESIKWIAYATEGYIKGNVQWVHKDINYMKSNFEQPYFIDVCKMIAKKNE